MRPIIRVENLGKQYRIGAKRAPYLTLRESLTDAARAPLRWFRGERSPAENTFWALQDVNIDIRPGEVVGVIGRNGAGKSTLLKILSRITEPTTGQVDLYGRIGSLLEVGTGFHPELTGRENIYLNGSILGMARKEIERKFDAVVAFAEVEQFLDTPVKRYSSGMYVRLAFAVAAHLEPEILLVDEVLAVGDVAFQQKCLNHMRTLTRRGMTIVLVSHNMAAIQCCCQRGILVEGGRVAADGKPVEVIEHYRHALQKGKSPAGSETRDARGGVGGADGVSITGFEMFGEDGNPTRDLKFGEAVRIRIDLHAARRVERPMINFGIVRGDGVNVCNFNNWFDNAPVPYIVGACTLEGWLPPLRLVPDYYEIHVLVWHWGGGHLPGDLTKSTPLAYMLFGDFSVSGPCLNAEDGVFQLPASKWRFRQGETDLEFVIPPDNRLEYLG